MSHRTVQLVQPCGRTFQGWRDGLIARMASPDSVRYEIPPILCNIKETFISTVRLKNLPRKNLPQNHNRLRSAYSLHLFANLVLIEL